ncbi:MAG: M56 family metallopeptidase [Cytophagia bacterium]|nr:M56 family metallopeptidase [Cytophagia bacterium]
MEALLIWSLKASGLLVILFLIYYLLFQNNTAFQLRRFLLISLLALCSVAPLLKIEVTDAEPKIVQQAYQIQQSIVKPISSEKEGPISPIEYKQADTSTQSTDWMAILIKVYLIGIGLSLAIFLLELIRVFVLSISAEKDYTLGKNIFRHAYVKSPFSFGKWIFIPKLTQYADSSWAIILRHELVHINQKHSLDLILIRLIQSIIWYNPIIYLFQKELKAIHEAQADEEVLEQFDFKTYASTLMNVSLSSQQVQITHSFAVISSLSKRLKLMKTHKTRIRTTIISLLIISTFSIGIVSWSSLKAQDKKSEDKGYILNDEETATILTEEGIKNFRIASFENGYAYKLINSHLKVLNVLESENPESTLRYRYFKNNIFHAYLESYLPGQKPLYITEVSDEQKKELYNLIKDDTVSFGGNKLPNGTYTIHYYAFKDFIKSLDEVINKNFNYLMIYESSKTQLNYDEKLVFDPEEVDVLPEVVGGIENLVKTIAFDITIPEDISKDQLPETIDFEFVVQGGKNISHLNLLTELKGTDKKNKPYYLFFGKVHNHLRGKIATIYPWKRGVKDGKEVLVRMKISIPTKYMM